MSIRKIQAIKYFLSGRKLDQYFTKEAILMINKHIKCYSTLLVIRKMHIKTMMRHHYRPARMAKINQSIPSVDEDGSCTWIRALTLCCWEGALVQPLWRNWQYLLKLNQPLSLWPNNSTPGHIPNCYRLSIAVFVIITRN